MTAASSPGARARGSVAVWALVAALAAFAWAWLLGRDLFVLAEARGFALNRPPIDPLQLLVLPELGWGSGRLLGIAFYQAVGGACGVDAGCYNAVAAVLAGIGGGLAVVVGARLTGSLAVALGAAAIWIASPTFVGMALWQATWFDWLVFGLVLAAIGAWWWALGRERIGRAGAAAFILGSIALLALAFNAKETAYTLLVVLPVIAIVRGAARPGGIRRNLLLVAAPLAYGAWFVAWGITHIDAAYAEKELQEGFLGGLEGTLGAMFARGDEFMYVRQAVADADRLQTVAGVLLVLAVVLVGVLLAAAAWVARRDRRGVPRDPDAPRFLVAWGGELVLVALLLASILLLSPTRAPTAYYLSLVVWPAAALVGSLIRRAAAIAPRGRVLATAAVGAWVAGQAITLAGVVLPGSTWAQVVDASGRMREVGAQLRTLLADREGGPFVWRTIGAPGTSFLVLRGPGQNPRDATEAYPPGGDLLPFLLGDARLQRRFTALQGVTLEEIASGSVPETLGERTTTVVIDEGHRLLLVLYEGRPILEAAGSEDAGNEDAAPAGS